MNKRASQTAAHRASVYLRRACNLELSPRTGAAVLLTLKNTSLAPAMLRPLADRLVLRLTPEWMADGPLADVFSVLHALHAYSPSLITGDHLACAIKRLLAEEQARGGPYGSPTDPLYIEANVQIALCLQWAAAPLPRVMALLEDAVRQIDLNRGLLKNLVLAQRIFELGVGQALIIERLKQLPAIRGRSTPAQIALAVSTLRQAGIHTPQEVLPRLLSHQKPDGSWASAQSLHAASQLEGTILDTALVLQALSSGDKKPILASEAALRQRQVIMSSATLSLQRLPHAVRSTGLEMLHAIRRADKTGEIAQLPQFFAASLKAKPMHAGPRIIDLLGQANIFCWMAYTIYDDFLDRKGVRKRLPLANLAMRKSLQLYDQALPDNAAFAALVRSCFDAADAANAWELRYCRLQTQEGNITIENLPDYDSRAILADRSLPHILGPMAILALEGVALHSKAWEAVFAALKHYLIARQLNDDLHDWVDDLSAGHASYVVTSLLQQAGTRPGAHALSALTPALRRYFWQDALPCICRVALGHLSQAREALADSRLLRPHSRIDELLCHIEGSLQASLVEHKNSHDFLRSMRQ